MTRTLLLGINLFFTYMSISCSGQTDKIVLNKWKDLNEENFNHEFKEYSKLNESSDYESSAVLCSLIGDNRKAISFATKDRDVSAFQDLHLGLTDEQISVIVKNNQEIINTATTSHQSKEEARRLNDILKRPRKLEELFSKQKTFLAESFIVDKAKDVHFLLINEAHYSSQNRNFTKNLLKPLWEIGYRYLALEALGYNDAPLRERGYPVKTTGYYIQDFVFGNLIREALELGFQLVSYDYTSLNENLRDSIQALNIYNKTLAKDLEGKVLIHAGYSHISESGDINYRPMGYQLKRISGKEILTIDQHTMSELDDLNKVHPYYQFVSLNYKIEQPVVFTDSSANALVDPVNSFGIDIQVYHPITTYFNGRPSWLVKKSLKQIQLPSTMAKFKGHLLQINKPGEIDEAIPIDQFIIEEKSIGILKPGQYIFKLIDTEGTLRARGSFKVP